MPWLAPLRSSSSPLFGSDGGPPIQRGAGGQAVANIAHSAWFDAEACTQRTTSDAANQKVEHDLAPGVIAQVDAGLVFDIILVITM